MFVWFVTVALALTMVVDRKKENLEIHFNVNSLTCIIFDVVR